MDRCIRVGVVGCGYWGPNLIRNFRSLSGCSVAAICDQNDKRLSHMKQLYPETRVSHTLDQLLEDNVIDAIAIATPVWTHHVACKEKSVGR